MEKCTKSCSIVPFIWKLVWRYFDTFINLDQKIEELKDRTEYLSVQADDIKAQLRADDLARIIIKKEVVTWLEEVDRTIEEVQNFREKVEGTNIVDRLWLAQQVMGLINKVGVVESKGIFPNGLVIDAPPPKGMLIPMEDFFSKAASARNCEKVRKHLTEHKVTRIGVVGMRGVGKTAIMKQICNEMVEGTADYFDKIIWVTVSEVAQGSIIEKIQDSIAKQLYTNQYDYEKYWKSKDEMGREMALCVIFSQKRCLLILDDVWEIFHLDKVGVPHSSNVTVVLTTRSKNVAQKLGCKIVEVDLLTEPEANDLFMASIALDVNELTPEVKDIVETIAQKCARLPLAIMTISRNMRKVEDVNAWRVQLDQILPKEIKDEHADVLKLLRFSFDRLENEELKECFLYCALYPEDHDIPCNELVEYWIMEGLIDEMDSREAMFVKGHHILKKLTNVSLLERAHGECLRIHDLIREMSLKIIGTRFYSGDQIFEEVPSDVWSQGREKVFLNNNRIRVLPERPPCCQLTTLLLRRNDFLDSIPDSIFSNMPLLEVLDLSYTQIQSLPKSISELENLHALSAAHCHKLGYVPPLAKLKKLKELNMRHSRISEVPGLEELVNLRNLDLFKTLNLHSFPSNDLCRLSSLQCLRIDESNVKVSAGDLLCLNTLEVVGVTFQDGQELIRYLGSPQCQRLKKYHLFVEFSYHYVWGDLEEIGKEVRFDMSGIAGHRLVLPSNIESLQIQGDNGNIGSSDAMPWKNTNDLRKFKLGQCHGIEFIFWTPSSSSSENCRAPLGRVEKLILEDLPNLRVLFREVAPLDNFSFNLKELDVHKCSGIIKNIFSAVLLQNNFPNLEKLRVTDCENLKEIIEDGAVEVSRETMTLPNLKFLLLSNLRALESIYKGTMVCTSLYSIKVQNCPMLKRLPFFCSLTDEGQQQALSAPALHVIEAEKEWWDSLEWDDSDTRGAFQPFFEKLR